MVLFYAGHPLFHTYRAAEGLFLGAFHATGHAPFTLSGDGKPSQAAQRGRTGKRRVAAVPGRVGALRARFVSRRGAADGTVRCAVRRAGSRGHRHTHPALPEPSPQNSQAPLWCSPAKKNIHLITVLMYGVTAALFSDRPWAGFKPSCTATPRGGCTSHG